MAIPTTTPVADTERLGGEKALSYVRRKLVYSNADGLPITQVATIEGGIPSKSVLEIEYNYTSRPYPSQDTPTIYDTAFFKFRTNATSSLWTTGSCAIKGYQINGDVLEQAVELTMHIRTTATGLSIMSRYGSTGQYLPSGFVGTVTQSKLFRLKNVWIIYGE